jgi:hypothetical protein
MAQANYSNYSDRVLDAFIAKANQLPEPLTREEEAVLLREVTAMKAQAAAFIPLFAEGLKQKTLSPAALKYLSKEEIEELEKKFHFTNE